MFHIFKKKKFLVDYLDGFIDMHNHILPGIDDGAKNLEDTLQLMYSFAEIGIENFIATPHIMDNYYPNTPHSIQNALALVKNELNKNNLKNFTIDAAAEHMIDANFEHLLDRLEVMPINKQYLLIEMSYLQASLNFDAAVKKINENRYFPILAHPERYHYLHNSNKYTLYKNSGILFQMNLLSLGGYYGKEITAAANKLLDQNLIDFVGTDVHNLKQLNALKSLKISNKRIKQLQPIIEKTIYNFG